MLISAMFPARLNRRILFKIFLVFVVAFGVFILASEISTPVLAQATTDPATVNVGAGGEPVTSKNYGPTQNAKFAFDGLMKAGISSLIGGLPTGEGTLVDEVQPDGTVKTVIYKQVPGGGAVGQTIMMTASLFQKPLSSTDYLAEIGQRVGLVHTAYAQVQGQGSEVIAPIRVLWEYSQRIAFLCFILIFITIGLMVMFRRRVNPQTIISIQSALPGLVVALILVTFSYFIAALLVDLCFLLSDMVARLFMQAYGLGPSDLSTLINIWQQNGIVNLPQPFQGWLSFILPADKNQPYTLGFAFNVIMFSILKGMLEFLLGLNFTNGLASLVQSMALSGVRSVIMILPLLILIIAFFVQLVRLLFALITTFLQILVLAIIGPFYFLLSAIPGRGNLVMVWVRLMLGNVMVFPAVIATAMFAAYILNSNVPIGRTPPGVLDLFSVVAIKHLLGFGVFLALPAIPGTVRKAIAPQTPGGNLIQAATAPVAAIGAAAGSKGGQAILWRGTAAAGQPARGLIPYMWGGVRYGRW